MSKYHDDSSHAENPGGLSLSMAKLSKLEPALLTDRTYKCGPLCPVDHPSAEMVERAKEHLVLGDSRAAVVVSVAPLLVAAYSDDVDTVALLAFPDEFVGAYDLRPGSRLLTVNTYGEIRGGPTNEVLCAVDLIRGPNYRRWSNFQPFIADFLSDDTEHIEARKREISEDEWNRARTLADVRLKEFGASTARDGRISTAGTPTQIWGGEYFESPTMTPARQVVKRLHALHPVGLKFAKVGVSAALAGFLLYAMFSR